MPDGLADFLAAGPPPVCVGFGSVIGPDPAQLGRIVAEGLRMAGHRGVAVTADGSLEVEANPDLFVVSHVPYSWLFARVAAVIHAGSVGVSAEALRAGTVQGCVLPVAEARAWARVLREAHLTPHL